jgi:hypothetical protein
MPFPLFVVKLLSETLLLKDDQSPMPQVLFVTLLPDKTLLKDEPSPMP